MPGTFIVMEGPDGSGTTRHSELLAERMRSAGYDVVLTAEPTQGPIGLQIRSLLQGTALPPADALQLLFCADRAQHVAEVISPALEAGKVVICDRYALSTVVYGAATGLSRKWLTEINLAFPQPDLTIVTLPPFAVCMERIGKRGTLDQFEKASLQERVYEQYKTIKEPSTFFVDTSGDKNEVAEHVWQTVREYFGPVSRESIRGMR